MRNPASCKGTNFHVKLLLSMKVTWREAWFVAQEWSLIEAL
jgi:hypothetical protein